MTPFEKKPRIIYNDDTVSLRRAPQPHTADQISLAVDYLRNTHVDCLCWCMTDDIAYSYRSRTIENIYDDYYAKRQISPKSGRDLTWTLYSQGIDYLPLLIRRAHEADILFFGSFRMNDAHHKSRPNGPGATDFWKAHQHYRLWEVTESETYYNACLDYSYPEVRQRRLDAINEVARTYDVDGIELDFMRNPYIFQPSQAWSKRNILTDFIRTVRENLQRAGREKGKTIGLIIRTPFDQQKLRDAGIDMEQWIRNRYMDILVMSSKTNDYDVTLVPWLTMCRENGILFYPSIERSPTPNWAYVPHNYVYPKIAEDDENEMLRGMAQNYWGQGADGIYMFNYPCRLCEGGEIRFNDRPAFEKAVSLLSEIGQPKVLEPLAKRYAFFKDLPISVESGRPPQYHQTITFKIFDPNIRSTGATAVLRFRQVAKRNPHVTGKFRTDPIVKPGVIKYLLNGNEISEDDIARHRQPAGKIVSGFELAEHELIEIKQPAGKLNFGENSLAFHIPKFPEERDPYVYIYQLEVDVLPG